MRSIHRYVAPSHPRAFRVVVIGAGGNGSVVLNSLPYLHQALLAWGHTGLEVAAMDSDTVSPYNCVRQPFGVADVGLNKATVLIDRINLFHGFQWRAIPGRFACTNPLEPFEATYGIVDLVISCVDTKSARAEMHKAFFGSQSSWGRRLAYWLDLGNGASFGQYVLGQPLNNVNRRRAERLRCATELFPDLMDIENGEDDLPSCSAAEALDRQEPFVNNVLATSAMSLVTRLLRYGEIDHHGAFYNAQTGRMAPMPIDPAQWAKMKRRRVAAKAA